MLGDEVPQRRDLAELLVERGHDRVDDVAQRRGGLAEGLQGVLVDAQRPHAVGRVTKGFLPRERRHP
ncbi:MAG: hypothetical protein IT200_01690 [Thermoleophilia bacterium]|nr:hypothetical protein [Thermoleophilia bacterium]